MESAQRSISKTAVVLMIIAGVAGFITAIALIVIGGYYLRYGWRPWLNDPFYRTWATVIITSGSMTFISNLLAIASGYWSTQRKYF